MISIGTVTELISRGVQFLNVPDSYYDEVLDRVGTIDEDIAPLKKLGILVDRDDEGVFASDLYEARTGSSYCLLRNHPKKRR